MAIGYKTLIMIDNSMSVGKANFILSKETARYICEHLNENDECRIAVFGEDIEYLTDYSNDRQMLSDSIDKIEMTDKDTYITDNLAAVLNEWMHQDVACRNIILFTDGEEKEPVLHANEELYYMLKEAGYPVYVVQSVEKKSIPAAKNLSAIATISGGELLLTEFENSEGGSERIIGDRIVNNIEAVRSRMSGHDMAQETGSGEDHLQETDALEGESGVQGGDNVTGVNEKDGEAASDDTALYIASEMDTDGHVEEHMNTISYMSNDTTPIIRRGSAGAGPAVSLNVLLPALGLTVALVFAISLLAALRRKNRKNREEKKTILSRVNEEIFNEAAIAENAEDYDCMTYKLDMADEGATRLLDQGLEGHDIVLEDCLDPTRLYRAVCDDILVVGRSRNLCDLVIDNDDSISGRHCELSVKGDTWYVRDLESSNGTRVNRQKVFQELLLKNGDILQLGQSSLLVRI